MKRFLFVRIFCIYCHNYSSCVYSKTEDSFKFGTTCGAMRGATIAVCSTGVVELLSLCDRVFYNLRAPAEVSQKELFDIRGYYLKKLQEQKGRKSCSVCQEVTPDQRSLSPSPSLDCPRNSISDPQNPAINVEEADEQVYSDASCSPTRRDGTFLKPSKNSKSRSPSVNGRSCSTSRSVSPFPFKEPPGLADVPLERTPSPRLGKQLDSVDSSVASFERETTSSKSEFTYVRYEESGISSAKTSNCVAEETKTTERTLEEAARKLSEGSQDMENATKPEPFWVNEWRWCVTLGCRTRCIGGVVWLFLVCFISYRVLIPAWQQRVASDRFPGIYVSIAWIVVRGFTVIYRNGSAIQKLVLRETRWWRILDRFRSDDSIIALGEFPDEFC